MSENQRNGNEDGQVLLLSANHVAKMLQVSTRTLWRLLAAGKLIGPVKIGRSVRWRKDELMEWIAAGCPPNASQKKEGVSNGFGFQEG